MSVPYLGNIVLFILLAPLQFGTIIIVASLKDKLFFYRNHASNQYQYQYLLFCFAITVYVDSSFPMFMTFNIFAIDSISYKYRFLGVECPVSKLTLRFPI